MPGNLAEMGEVEAIGSFTDVFGACDELVVGPGEDDCAVLELGDVTLVQSSDRFVEGVHFTRDTDPEGVGWHAAAASASDVAAMGARVLSMTLSVSVPGDREPGFLRSLAKGADAAMTGAGGCIVGGDLTQGSVAVDCGVLGVAEGEPVLRSGAEEGDVVCVTGPLGGAAAGEMVLREDLEIPGREEAVNRLVDVPLRADAGLRLSGRATAATDLSDGLYRGLECISEASGVGLRADLDRVPLHRCAAEAVEAGLSREFLVDRGGDYELLFTVPPEAAEDLGYHVIGEVVGESVEMDGASGLGGYDAFG